MTEEKKLLKDFIRKDITQQIEFLKTYPECDGRGLLIAILDSGIDVSFDGMQKTTTGSPKVVDCYDFTGAGCVDTSFVKKMDENNSIVGLSGRTLKIPLKWKNPSGEWHLGIKSIYEMCSGAALEGIIKKRKEFISQQNEILKQSIEEEKKKEKNEEATILEYLKMTENLSKDSLVADCIVWFDGEKWHACIDTSFIGDLESVKVLTNYEKEHKYDKFWNILTYCIKIHDNGNLLDIITAYDDHGTFVAQVAAANFPGEPERNGLAPGAQIVSMTVMDSRNGTYLNDHALKKALEKCIELKVDIINCSFGCATERRKKEIKELTKKHGIMFIHAAGNEGPVYFSVERRCTLLKEIFIIGSVLIKKESDDDKITYKIPSYSSRGPNCFGDRGICFSAPGDATISMPEYYLQKILNIEGTSFAAPNFAGSIACLISALKANSIKYSPSIIKFALSKTAFLPPNGNALEYGHGIIQIYEAFKFLKSFDFTKMYQICSKCEVKQLKKEKNGIFLKFYENDAINNNSSYTIDILHKPKGDKVALQITPGAEKFISYSDVKNHQFSVKIDPTKLKLGTINYAEISGVNSKNSFGNIFHLPITIIVPQKVTAQDNYSIQKTITTKPEIPYRFFILPPEQSCLCIVKITVAEEISTTTQLFFQYAAEDVSVRRKNSKWLTFYGTNKNCQTHHFEIWGNTIYEILFLLSPYQKQLVKFNVEIKFYGICQKKNPKSSKDESIFEENMLIIWNHLQDFAATLSMEFKKVSYELFPENTTEIIKNIYDLDSIKYLKLMYTFEVSKETKCCFKMNHKKKYPLLRAQVFTESKKFVHGFYTYFEELITLLPGKYIIIAYVFYPNSTKNSTIPTIKNLPSITVTMELDHQITPEIYSNSKMNNKSQYTKHKSIKFKNGERQIYFENMLSTDTLPYSTAQNVTFHGSANFCIEDFQLCIPLEHKYTFKNEQKEVENAEKENFKQIINENLSPETNETNSKKLDNKNEPETTIPLKFKENFGSELTDTFFSTKICSKINDENDAISKNNLTKTQSYIIDICDLYLKNINNENIQNEFAKIKQTLQLGHLGTTLLHLNKLSIKYQTNPAFKFIDLAIIELLKHLKWDHLVEAHCHALLDRHRNYWRLL